MYDGGENMKIKNVKLENFRGYKEEIVVDFNDLTVFVGKNDVGKSTVLEALDIFFNDKKAVVKIEKNDINKKAIEEGNNEIKISVIFENLPNTITIDSTNTTSLRDEFLLNNDGNLEIIKKYPNAGTPKVFIKAYHPTNRICKDLLLKKISNLKNILDENEISCDNRNKSATIRKAIWDYYSHDLQLNNIEIDVTKEDAKNIWDQLKNYMPLYSLFQSDRKNSDGDSEVQDPMKIAVNEILKDDSLRNRLEQVANEVELKLKEVANNTLEKLNEMNPEIADSLEPVIPTSDSLKWADVFKNVSISSNENIPINKRGSGVKRLVLLNFFRAEAERRRADNNVPDIIYAIEEPETSQHPKHQRKLIEAFLELSNIDHTQVILTTHSPAIVKLLDFDHLKLITDNSNNGKSIINIERAELPYPSLNEVNFLAFEESNDEYHNELYGYIESENELRNFKNGRHTVPYNRERRGNIIRENVTINEYIRHQIHHPENTHNTRFTHDELQQSISEMRVFIQSMDI